MNEQPIDGFFTGLGSLLVSTVDELEAKLGSKLGVVTGAPVIDPMTA